MFLDFGQPKKIGKSASYDSGVSKMAPLENAGDLDSLESTS